MGTNILELAYCFHLEGINLKSEASSFSTMSILTKQHGVVHSHRRVTLRFHVSVHRCWMYQVFQITDTLHTAGKMKGVLTFVSNPSALSSLDCAAAACDLLSHTLEHLPIHCEQHTASRVVLYCAFQPSSVLCS